MGVKRSFKQILALMVSSRTYIRSLSVVLTVIMALQLAVVPASAAQWTKEPQKEIESVVSEDTTEGDVVDPTALESETKPTEPALKNTYALVVSTGGQSGDSIQYFKVVYEDIDGIRRSEYILKDDSKSSFDWSQKFSNVEGRRLTASHRFSIVYGWDQICSSIPSTPLQAEQRDTYLFETVYDVKRIVGLEIMQNAGQWDCQGLWLYQVDQIYGEEMYGYVSSDAYVNFSGWRLAELEMTYKGGERIYTTLQTSRPKLYRMGENGHPEFNLLIWDRSEAEYDSTNNAREYAMRLDITDVYGAGIEQFAMDKPIGEVKLRDSLKMDIRYQDTFGCVQTISVNVLPSSLLWALDKGVSDSTKLVGYAQQGDTLLFPVKIPYFADLLKVSLHCDFPNAEETLNISGIGMYDLSLSIADVKVDEARAAIVPSISYNPV